MEYIVPLTFMPTIPTFAVRETSVSRTANVGTVGKNELIVRYRGDLPQEDERSGELWRRKLDPRKSFFFTNNMQRPNRYSCFFVCWISLNDARNIPQWAW